MGASCCTATNTNTKQTNINMRVWVCCHTHPRVHLPCRHPSALGRLGLAEQLGLPLQGKDRAPYQAGATPVDMFVKKRSHATRRLVVRIKVQHCWRAISYSTCSASNASSVCSVWSDGTLSVIVRTA